MYFTKLALYASAATLLATMPSLAEVQPDTQLTQPTNSINLPEQALQKSLTALAKIYNVSIVADPTLLRGHSSNPVEGIQNLDLALDHILAGTGLEKKKVGAANYVIIASNETTPAQSNSAPSRSTDTPAPVKPSAVKEDVRVFDKVMVTANKRLSEIDTVQFSLAVLNEDDVKDRQISKLDNLVDEIPGVSVNYAFGGPNAGMISIRGIGGADDYKPNGNPSTAFHIDGIYQTSNAYLAAPLFDLERVEVLKGPQGTLYGRNTTAGVVNAISRRPTEEFEGYVDVSTASHDRYNLEGAVGGPITDRIGVRAAVYAEQGGGFMDGLGAGNKAGLVPTVDGELQTQVPPVNDPGERSGFGDADLFAGRVTVDFDITDETNLTIRSYGSKDRGDTRQYDRIAFEDDNATRNAGEDNDPYKFYTNKYFQQRVDISGISAELNHIISDNLQLTALAGAQESTRNYEGNGDGTSYPRFQFEFDEELSQSTVEMRLSNVGDDRFNWILGTFAVSDDVDFKSTWTSFAVQSVYESPYAQTRRSFAVFGQADYDLTEKFQVTGGLRFTDDTVNYQGRNEDFDPWGISTFETTFGTESPFSWDRQFEDDNISGRVSAQYFFTEDFNIYAAYGTGYRGGGFDGTSIFTPEETLPFDSETVEGFEAGLRWSNDRLRFTLDTFSYEFEELQATARLSNDTNGRTNVGAAEIQGAELQLAAMVFETGNQSLDLNVSAAVLDSEITAFSSNRANDVAGTIGDSLPGAPELTANLSLIHNIQFVDGWNLKSRLDASHHGEESNRLNATDGNTSDAYELLNARMELSSPAGWSVYAFGRNITDEVYFPELNGATRLVGAPATFGVGARFDF